MIKPKYNIDELKHNGDSDEEHARLRGIFEDIKQRSKDGESIAVLERDFFCSSLYMLKEGNVNEYPICYDWRFKWLFYRYWYDLDGTSIHEYVEGLGTAKPTRTQIDRELEELRLFADEWLLTVQDTKLSSDGLKDAAKETRDELKALEKDPQFNEYGFFRQCFRYERFKLSVLLRLKFAYLISEEIFATVGADEISFNLIGQQLIFNKYSCIHILNRHYAKDQKVVNRNKSFHEKIVPPRKLPEILAEVISSIENSGVYVVQDHNKIYLKYKECDFALWSEVKYKQLKGSIGNIPFNRIQTFYPIESTSELKDLTLNYVEVRINDDLSVYLKK